MLDGRPGREVLPATNELSPPFFPGVGHFSQKMGLDRALVSGRRQCVTVGNNTLETGEKKPKKSTTL